MAYQYSINICQVNNKTIPFFLVDSKYVVLTAPDHALVGFATDVSATIYDGEKVASKGVYSFTWKDSNGKKKVNTLHVTEKKKANVSQRVSRENPN